MRKLFLILFITFIFSSIFAEVNKISVEFGYNRLEMKDFNNYTKEGFFFPQMDIDRIESGKSIALNMRMNQKKLKYIDLEFSLGYLPAKAKGSADSLFHWSEQYIDGRSVTYNHYVIPMSLELIYQIPLQQYLKNKINVEVGGGFANYFASSTENWKELGLNGEIINNWEDTYFDHKFGYHINSKVNFNLPKDIFIGLEVMYRILDNHQMSDKFELNYSGIGFNCILGVNI